MTWLALLTWLCVLSGCAFLEASTDVAPLAPRGSPSATIELAISVADSDTDEPMLVDTVWVDNEIAYRHVSYFVLLLPGDYPLTQDGHEIRITAAGYESWVTHIRVRTRADRSMTLPVHMHRAKPRTSTDSGAQGTSVTSPAWQTVIAPLASRTRSAPESSTCSATPSTTCAPMRTRTTRPSVIS